jgi:hypothetical protein
LSVTVFLSALVAYEQERLAIQWGATVIMISSLNIIVLIFAIVNKHDYQSKGNDVIHS